jgi:ATP-binding protein involved in chromosome partitioning
VPIEQQVKQAIEGLYIIGFEKTLGEMGLLQEITSDKGKVTIVLNSEAMGEDIKEKISKTVSIAVAELPGVSSVDVKFIAANAGSSDVKNVIAIMSGKGGVGKSLISGLTAIALRRAGYEVGILDADITGPSIPRMFGITERPGGDETGLLPVKSRSGISIMSINLLLPSEDEAVVWRGPLIARAISQFWEEVKWGSLDYLIIDLPPGTADAPLTVLQSLPVTGIIIVSTPQELTSMVVRKAVNMAHHMNKQIIGVVENMSYLYVSEINRKIELFGKSRGEEMAKAAGAPLLGNLPIDPQLAMLCDQGDIELYNSEIFNHFTDNLNNTLNNLSK